MGLPHLNKPLSLSQSLSSGSLLCRYPHLLRRCDDFSSLQACNLQARWIKVLCGCLLQSICQRCWEKTEEVKTLSFLFYFYSLFYLLAYVSVFVKAALVPSPQLPGCRRYLGVQSICCICRGCVGTHHSLLPLISHTCEAVYRRHRQVGGQGRKGETNLTQI